MDMKISTKKDKSLSLEKDRTRDLNETERWRQNREQRLLLVKQEHLCNNGL